MLDAGRCLFLLLVLGLLPACGNPVRHGRTLYVEGRLIEAAEVFEHGEAHLAKMSDRDRVSYGLYRGATLLKLGDLDGAGRWLYFAQQAENHNPGSLEPSDVQTLRLAFTDLDRRRALVNPNVDRLKEAVAHSSSGAQTLAADVVLPAESSAPAVPSTIRPSYVAPIKRPRGSLDRSNAQPVD
jgi:hypothetical protein